MSEDKIIAADDAALQKRAKLLAELSDITKAADEVGRLREENARLREALKPFAKMADELDVLVKGEELWEHDDTQWINVNKFGAMPTVGNLRAARAAIREGGKE